MTHSNKNVNLQHHNYGSIFPFYGCWQIKHNGCLGFPHQQIFMQSGEDSTLNFNTTKKKPLYCISQKNGG